SSRGRRGEVPRTTTACIAPAGSKPGTSGRRRRWPRSPSAPGSPARSSSPPCGRPATRRRSSGATRMPGRTGASAFPSSSTRASASGVTTGSSGWGGRSRRASRLQAKVHRPVEAFGALHVAERLELAPEPLAGGTGEVALESLVRLEAVDEEVAEPTLLVALLEPAALRPQEARLADHLRHVLLLEPAEVALAAVGRDPGLHHVEDGRVHGPLVARPLETNERLFVCLGQEGSADGPRVRSDLRRFAHPGAAASLEAVHAAQVPREGAPGGARRRGRRGLAVQPRRAAGADRHLRLGRTQTRGRALDRRHLRRGEPGELPRRAASRGAGPRRGGC